jgi:carbon storage regulator
MLILVRRPGESVIIGDNIIVTVLHGTKGGNIRLGITAPRDTPIWRSELAERIKAEKASS